MLRVWSHELYGTLSPQKVTFSVYILTVLLMISRLNRSENLNDSWLWYIVWLYCYVKSLHMASNTLYFWNCKIWHWMTIWEKLKDWMWNANETLNIEMSCWLMKHRIMRLIEWSNFVVYPIPYSDTFIVRMCIPWHVTKLILITDGFTLFRCFGLYNLSLFIAKLIASNLIIIMTYSWIQLSILFLSITFFCRMLWYNL